jgi:hypothetical protein
MPQIIYIYHGLKVILNENEYFLPDSMPSFLVTEIINTVINKNDVSINNGTVQNI